MFDLYDLAQQIVATFLSTDAPTILVGPVFIRTSALVNVTSDRKPKGKRKKG